MTFEALPYPSPTNTFLWNHSWRYKLNFIKRWWQNNGLITRLVFITSIIVEESMSLMRNHQYVYNVHAYACFHTIYLTLTMLPWVLPCKIVFVFSKFSQFQRLFYKILNQYQACLYLFECIFHGDSKYSNEVQKLWHFWHCLCKFRSVVCSYLPRGKC